MRPIDADSLIKLVTDSTILGDGFKWAFVAVVNGEPTVEPEPKWIPVTVRLPEMHDAGILKKLGVNQRSKKCIITVAHEEEAVVDNDAELRDGEWYSTYLRFLKAGKKPFKVTAWMPLPEPYKGENT